MEYCSPARKAFPMNLDGSKRRYIAACGFSFAVMAASMTWAIHIGNEAGAIEHELLHTSTAVSLLKAELDHLKSHTEPRGRKL